MIFVSPGVVLVKNGTQIGMIYMISLFSAFFAPFAVYLQRRAHCDV
jgi:hypothetical protein